MMVSAARRDDLHWLVEQSEDRDELCISLLIPTHRAGPETQQDSIRLKNLLNRSEHALVERGMRRPVARDLLAPLRRLVEDGDFWRRQDRGLCIFLSVNGGEFRLWHTPYPISEELYIGDHFHVRPLLPLLSRDLRFYVIALSQQRIALYEGDDELREIELPAAPKGMQDLAPYIDTEKSLQFHTGTGESMRAAPGAGRRAMFHGHGTDDTRENRRVHELFRALDNALRERLLHRGNATAPLIPAGVEWVIPVFRATTTYPRVTDEAIPGNFDHRPVRDLYEPAKAIAQRLNDRRLDQALASYEQHKGLHRTTCDIARIARLSLLGEVELLLVDLEAHIWGRADVATGDVRVHENRQDDDRDLIELAVLHTLRTSGQVHVMERERMPDRAAAAAVLRAGAEKL